jgi:hypothetical protein
MHTQYLMSNCLVFDNSRKRELVKHVVDLLEDTSRVVDIFLESLSTFFTKAKMPIHISVFVVASE